MGHVITVGDVLLWSAIALAAVIVGALLAVWIANSAMKNPSWWR